MEKYTYRKLLEELNKLSEKELDMEVMCFDDERGIFDCYLSKFNNNMYDYDNGNDTYSSELFAEDDLTEEELKHSTLMYNKGQVYIGGI